MPCFVPCAAVCACRVAGTLVFGANLLTPWALGLGLRLPLAPHLLLHSLMAARLALLQAPALCCAAPLAVRPGGARWGLCERAGGRATLFRSQDSRALRVARAVRAASSASTELKTGLSPGRACFN